MARDLARAVAGGSLVKSGIFGRRSVLGPDPRGARRARRRARLSTSTWRGVTLDIQGVRVYRSGAPVAFDAKALVGAHARRPRSPCGSICGVGKAVGARARLRPDVRLREDQRRVLQRPDRPTARAAAGADASAPGGVNRPLRRRGAELHPQVRAASARSSSTAARRWSIRRSSAASPRRSCCCSRPACSPVIVHGGGPEITQDAREAGARSRSSPTASASPAPRTCGSSRWC